MNEGSPPKISWFRFSIANLLVLMLGIAIGFAPLKLWELHEPPQPEVFVHLKFVQVPTASLEARGIDPLTMPDSAAAARDINESFLPHLNAMLQNKEAKVITEPTLRTLDGRPTGIQIGSQVPVPETDEDGTTVITYRDVGMRLDILPTILRNGRIRLAILQEVTKAHETQTEAIAGSDLPSVHKRSIDTQIEMAAGETLLIANVEEASLSPTDRILVIAQVEFAKPR